MCAGMSAGFVATICSNPLDIVATRTMATKRFTLKSSSVWEVCADMWRNEGLLAFYKGVGPNMLRIGSSNIIMWLCFEQIRLIGR